MSELPPDQELRDIIARDREKSRAQEAREAEEQRQERERQRIPQAIDALRRSGPLEDRSADDIWLDLLALLLDALADNGKAGLLDRLPKRGNARLFTRRCIELLRTRKRPQALEMLESIERGTLDGELARERNAELPDDLCRLLDIPIPQPPLAPSKPDRELTPETARAPEGGGGGRPAEQPTVWHHGGKSYSRDGRRPRLVSNEQHNVLKAFLDRDEALDTATLSKTGASNVTTVIDKLAEKFGDAVHRPENRGDGYFIRVRTLNKSN